MPFNNAQVLMPYTGPNSDGGSLFSSDQDGAQVQPGVTLTTPFTVECLFYIVQFMNRGQRFIMVNDGAGTNLAGLYLDNSNRLNAASPGASALGSTPTQNAWHHAVATVTSTTVTLYFAGVSVATAASAAYSHGSQYNLASDGANVSLWPVAFLSEIATYTTALSAARVAAHAAAADAMSSQPAFKGNGNSFGSPPSYGSVGTSTDLTSLLAAVEHVYQNNP